MSRPLLGGNKSLLPAGNPCKRVGTLTPAEELLCRVPAGNVAHILGWGAVLVDGHLVGLVSIGDMVAARIGELEQGREQLATYITHG